MKRYVDVSLYEDCRIVANKEDDGFEVSYLPTADVVEVKHGHWIAVRRRMFACGDHVGEMVIHHYLCSECGRQEDNREEYCHCGAKMDGKDGEKE